MVIFGAAVFPILGGMYFWFPKVTGRMYNESCGKISFWLTFVGTFVTFFPMHIVGILGMPRRNYTYPPRMGWTLLNFIETIGAYLLAAGLVLIVLNLSSAGSAPVAERPVRRRHARVVDHLTTAAVQLRRDPDRHQPVPDVRPRGSRARQQRLDAARGYWTRSRNAGDDRPGCGARRDPGDAAALDLAASAR